jgi:hypothetical protein
MSTPIKLKREGKPFIQVLGGGEEEDDSPRLHITDHDDPRLLEMPDEGEAKIKYKVKHREHREHDQNGKKKHKYSVSLAVHHIEPPESKKKKSKPYGDDARESMKNYFNGK